MEKQNNGVITDKNFKSNKDEIISNKENQIEEMAEILAKNFTLYDGVTTFCAGDFEWCAYQLMENGYRKESEVERLEWELSREREYIEFLKVNIVSGKQDVAREIFEELAEVFLTLTLKDGEKATLVDFKRYAELKKKYIGE